MKNGFALPVVMVFLVVLTLLGGTATLLTTRDLQVAGLYTSAQRAHVAAASGIDHAIVEFEEDGPTSNAWPVRGTVDGVAYRVEIARDTFDFGGGRAPVSYDEQSPGAVFNNDDRGDSVWVLTATARRAGIRSTQRQWLVDNAVPRLPAALTIHSGGATEIAAGATISGTNVALDGGSVDPTNDDTTSICGENRPAIHVGRDGVPAPTVGASVNGNPSYANAAPPYVTMADRERIVSPEDALGARPGSLDRYRRSGFLHGFGSPDALSGVIWITDEAAGSNSCLTRGGCARLDGSGVLIVHNPRYDPRQHDPTDPRYDPVIASSPAHQPARLHDLSGGRFDGILIVDELPAVASGPFHVRGAVVELSRRSQARRLEWPGARVEYSCESIARAARAAGSRSRLIAWTG